MSKIARIKNQKMFEAGFDDWDKKVPIPNDIDDEILDSTSKFPDNGISGAKIESLTVAKLTSGSITSKQIDLTFTEGAGDVYIGCGTYTPATWIANNGFLFGIDDSDSNKVKAYMGDGTSWWDWNVTTANKLTITDANISGTLSVGTIGIQNLLDNGDFEDWSAGVAVAPDGWILDGGGSIARVATPKIGTYCVQQTSDADGNSLYQQIDAEKGITYWQGKTISLGVWVYSAWAASARVVIHDGVSYSASSYHSGGADWEYLTVTRTINAAATSITIYLNNDGNTKSVLFDGAMLVEGSSPMPFSPKYRQWGHPSDYTKIDGGDIYTGTVTAAKISVTNLAAINADLGTVTAGTITGLTIQTDAAASTGIKLTSTSFKGYDATNTQRIQMLTDGSGWFGSATGLAWTTAGVLTAAGLTLQDGSVIGSTGTLNIESRANYPWTKGVITYFQNDGFTSAGVLMTRLVGETYHLTSPGDSFAYVQAGTLASGATWSNDMEFNMTVKHIPTTAQAGFWGLHSAALTIPTTARHIGFYQSAGVLYATNADGTTQTTTDISAGITLTNWNNFKFVWDNGTNIKFYVNDVLKATHTTNLPSGTTNPPTIHTRATNSGVGTDAMVCKHGQVLVYDI